MFFVLEYNPNKNNNKNDDIVYELDETPNKKETIIGLALGVGYLTFFAVIPMLILLAIFKQDIDQDLLSTIAQIIAACFTILMMAIASKRVINAVMDGFNKENLVKGLIYGLIMYGIAIAYGLIDQLIFGEAITNANQGQLYVIAKLSPAIFILFAVFAAPIVEELIFRYYLYKPLEKKGPVVAIIVSTLVFSLIHLIPSIASNTFFVDLRTLPSYVLPSLMFGIAYYRTKHIATTMIAHVIYNGITCFFIFMQISSGLI